MLRRIYSLERIVSIQFLNFVVIFSYEQQRNPCRDGNVFTALADKTRLRLLNLMRDEEVCVCFFTEVLGDSQPKVSRHLAYLRNAGLVTPVATASGCTTAFRSRMKMPLSGSCTSCLIGWTARNTLRLDREKYKQVCCSPEMLVQIARTPITFISTEADMRNEEQERVYDRAHNELDEFLL